ncbi:MAG: hypothetical protein H6581_27990 [Bacteroidia bacterium]|nr:hypothetical protein [Bacteroidia bacterium]
MKKIILAIILLVGFSVGNIQAQCKNAVTFTSPTGYVDFGKKYPATNHDQFALEAWVFWTGGTLKIYEEHLRHNFTVTKDGALYFNWGNNGTCLWQSSGLNSSKGVVPAKKWTHVAFRQNRKEGMDFFVNGKVVSNSPGYHNLDPKECGGNAIMSSDGPAGSAITDVRIWLVYRSNEDIAGNMNTCYTGKEAGLWAYYRFENGAADLGAGGLNGTFSGGMTADANLINAGTLGEGPKGCDCKSVSPEVITTCEGKSFKVDAAKLIYEQIAGKWVKVGIKCDALACNRRKVYCTSTDGSLWRYDGTPDAWTPANTLKAGQNLNAGKVMGQAEFLQAANGKYYFYMQENGDLGVWFHNPDPKVIYSSKTAPQTNATLYMQTDGNLVAYNEAGTPIFASDTSPFTDARYGQDKYKATRLVLENDGTLVLYSNTNFKVWTNTGGRMPLN